MFPHNAVCQSCKQPINVIERDYVADYKGLGKGRAWHMTCLFIPMVLSGTLNIRPDELLRWTTWQLKRIEESNSMLVQRTDSLAKEVERLMKAEGASDQDIKDFRAEFSVYDNEEGP